MSLFRPLLYRSMRFEGLHLLDSARAAPPDPTGVTVAFRGDDVASDSGERSMLSCGHNSLGDHLCDVHMPSEVSQPPLLVPAMQPTRVLISGQ